MEKIVHSLKSFRYTKEIRKILSEIQPGFRDKHDLNSIFKDLYEKKIISEAEFMAMETKMLLNRFTLLMEHQFNDLNCGVYLYDEKEKKLWNGSSSRVEPLYNEYSHGLSVINDIPDGDDIPIYGKGVIAITNVEKGEDIISLNHKRDLLKSSYKSICCCPLQYNDKMIGHTVLFSKEIREFTPDDLNSFNRYNELIEEKLAKMKAHLLSVIK
ncbi:hypothetical protein RCG23_06000 [Neobacillus sp. PS3-34]|uniref:GAF domain-containing protein n=1 Tax=Neobacillus sp. PS3-34 TaxID=3070678 RepID=UPI0027DF3392|nr:hypothetical protein [Neobacillus sp. PS3-34]WML49538.1 hypothetical protein RCG23_06000 [Neobacillus sp. PS3-34]